jgi:hypothetical protein
VNAATDVGSWVKEASVGRQSGCSESSEREGCNVGVEVPCKDEQGVCLPRVCTGSGPVPRCSGLVLRIVASAVIARRNVVAAAWV